MEGEKSTHFKHTSLKFYLQYLHINLQDLNIRETVHTYMKKSQFP